MSVSGLILLIVIAVPLTALVLVVIRFNIMRRRVATAVTASTEGDLHEIYDLIEAIPSEPAAGGILAYTGQRAATIESIVSIPEGLTGFPWAGRSFTIDVGKYVTFRRLPNFLGHTQLMGYVYRYVRIPRRRLRSGKHQNVFDPARYLSMSRDLRAKVLSICPQYSREFLSYLLCDRRVEFEPIDQARIGTSPAWVQDPELPSCSTCKTRMTLVVQVPGTLVHPRAFHRATCYLFGCEAHPEQMTTVAQFT